MTASAVRKRTVGKDVDSIGPRTRVGAKKIKLGDLVLVVDPHCGPRPFLAQVAGAYTVAGHWHLYLGAVPHTSRTPPRQSTRITCVKQVYRREGAAWTG